MADLLKTICYLAKLSKTPTILEDEITNNRINSVGVPLEKYIGKLFSNALELDDVNEINRRFNNTIAYKGTKNNPPDFILRNGDAIEVKKTEGNPGALQLNSSYPKAKLLKNDSRITQKARECEQWNEKDMIYAIGRIPKKNKTLESLWLIYGDCFAAENKFYGDLFERVQEEIKSGVQGVSDTKELGKLKNVDILKRTDLRIRGMWSVMHPEKIFKEIIQSMIDEEDEKPIFEMKCIMKISKYKSFPENSIQEIERLNKEKIVEINDITIPDPNKTDKEMDAKFIYFSL